MTQANARVDNLRNANAAGNQRIDIKAFSEHGKLNNAGRCVLVFYALFQSLRFFFTLNSLLTPLLAGLPTSSNVQCLRKFERDFNWSCAVSFIKDSEPGPRFEVHDLDRCVSWYDLGPNLEQPNAN